MEKRADQLRDRLEEEILTSRYRPGDRLDEQSLAAQFGVSRTPVREALFQLVAAGLIEHRPHRGTFVSEVGPRHLMEMFEVMAELEAMCARLAARRVDASRLAAIEESHRACEAAAESGDMDGYYYENEAFHDRIRAAGGNAFLREQAAQLHKRLKPYRRLQLRVRNRVAASFREHDAIVAAIRAGDPDAAAAAMRDHVAIQGERFTDLLASLEPHGESRRARD